MIKFENVSFTQENKHILKNIDWEINSHENWAILGLNGSGKTTLLKLINGYIWPTSGKLTVLNEVFGKTSIPDLRKRIGWISTDLQYRLNRYGSQLAESIVLSGKHASIGVWVKTSIEEEKLAIDILTSCGGEHLIGKKYDTLSQGERQIVLIARALMANPELLILDEPCNGLDLFARDRLLKRIEGISEKEKNTGLIFVTHYIEEIPKCFSHVLLLKEGEIFAKGKKEDIFQEEILTLFYEKPIEIRPWGDNQLTIFPK